MKLVTDNLLCSGPAMCEVLGWNVPHYLNCHFFTVIFYVFIPKYREYGSFQYRGIPVYQDYGFKGFMLNLLCQLGNSDWLTESQQGKYQLCICHDKHCIITEFSMGCILLLLWLQIYSACKLSPAVSIHGRIVWKLPVCSMSHGLMQLWQLMRVTLRYLGLRRKTIVSFISQTP